MPLTRFKLASCILLLLSPSPVVAGDPDPGTLLVDGSFPHVNGVFANGLVRWDGFQWPGLVEALVPLAAISDITAYNEELVVVGGFNLPGGGNCVVRWNGSSWLPFESEIRLASQFDVQDLSAQVFGGDLYVSGRIEVAGGKSSWNIARGHESGTGVPHTSGSGHSPRLWISSANPTSTGADIGFALPVASRIDLSIFDLAGRRIATLLSGIGNAGTSQVRWDGRDRNRSVVSGVYFVRLNTERESRVQKVIVQR